MNLEPKKKKKKGCFPSLGTIMLANGKKITMSDLQLGDKIQAGTVVP